MAGVIRTARAGDEAGIAAIWNPIIRHTTVTFTPDEKAEEELSEMIAGGRVLVAEEGGRILGFARWFQFRGGRGYAHTAEHTILLHEDARGRGLGRVLMQRLFEAAREDGMHSLFAGVSGENPAGISFHARLGFERVGLLPEVGWKFGRWIDLVLMQKRL